MLSVLRFLLRMQEMYGGGHANISGLLRCHNKSLVKKIHTNMTYSDIYPNISMDAERDVLPRSEKRRRITVHRAAKTKRHPMNCSRSMPSLTVILRLLPPYTFTTIPTSTTACPTACPTRSPRDTASLSYTQGRSPGTTRENSSRLEQPQSSNDTCAGNICGTLMTSRVLIGWHAEEL
jgi:hypothetical protein